MIHNPRLAWVGRELKGEEISLHKTTNIVDTCHLPPSTTHRCSRALQNLSLGSLSDASRNSACTTAQHRWKNQRCPVYIFFASLFSAHVSFLSIRIGLRSLARCLCISAALTHTCTVTNTGVTTMGTLQWTTTPHWRLGLTQIPFCIAGGGMFITSYTSTCPTEHLFPQEHYHYLEEEHEAHQGGRPFPAKASKQMVRDGTRAEVQWPQWHFTFLKENHCESWKTNFFNELSSPSYAA